MIEEEDEDDDDDEEGGEKWVTVDRGALDKPKMFEKVKNLDLLFAKFKMMNGVPCTTLKKVLRNASYTTLTERTRKKVSSIIVNIPKLNQYPL